MANSLHEMRPQEIMVVIFITLDWIYVLMNTTTMIPCRRNWNWNCSLSYTKWLSEAYLITSIRLSRAKKFKPSQAACKVDLQVFSINHW